jgi:hypothetical protein
MSSDGQMYPRRTANATFHTVHASRPQMITDRRSCVVLQAKIMISPIASKAAETAESAHKYNTRHKLGRPGKGEKPLNGQGQHQHQH